MKARPHSSTVASGPRRRRAARAGRRGRCCCPAAAPSSPAPAAVVDGARHLRRRRPAGRRADQHGARRPAEGHPGRHPACSLILAPYVIDQAASRTARAISTRSQARAAVKRDQRTRSPATIDFVRDQHGRAAGLERRGPARPSWPRSARPRSRSTRATARSTAKKRQLTRAGARTGSTPAATLGPGHPAAPPAGWGSAAVVSARLSLLLLDPAHRAGAALRAGLVERSSAAGQVLAPATPTSRSCWPSQDAGVARDRPRRRAPPPSWPALLVDAAPPRRDVVWLGSSDGDPGLTDALAAEVTPACDDPPEVEVLVGSYDVPGCPAARPGRGDGPAALARRLPVGRRADPRVAGAVPARGGLRGGRGDRDRRPGAHARGARRRAAAGGLPRPGRRRRTPDAPFDIDDVAGGIVAKLVRRHPHVFARRRRRHAPPRSSANWEQIKAAEKAGPHVRAGRHPGRAAGPGAGRQGGRAAGTRAGLSALARGAGGSGAGRRRRG